MPSLVTELTPQQRQWLDENQRTLSEESTASPPAVATASPMDAAGEAGGPGDPHHPHHHHHHHSHHPGDPGDDEHGVNRSSSWGAAVMARVDQNALDNSIFRARGEGSSGSDHGSAHHMLPSSSPSWNVHHNEPHDDDGDEGRRGGASASSPGDPDRKLHSPRRSRTASSSFPFGYMLAGGSSGFSDREDQRDDVGMPTGNNDEHNMPYLHHHHHHPHHPHHPHDNPYHHHSHQPPPPHHHHHHHHHHGMHHPYHLQHPDSLKAAPSPAPPPPPPPPLGTATNTMGSMARRNASNSGGKSNSSRFPTFPHGAAKLTWQQSYENLLVYRDFHGDCHVPQKYVGNPKLGGWVNKQRKKKKNPDKYGRLTAEHLKLLDEAGFKWE